jgi:hypothetical protein
MTSLDISSNRVGQKVRTRDWKFKKGGIFSASKWVNVDGRTQKHDPVKPLGLIAIARAVKNMSALSVFSLKKNGLGTKEAGKVIGEMLKGNSVLQELDVSDNRAPMRNGGDGPGFAQELADGIKDNGVLKSLNISANDITRSVVGPRKVNTTASEGDLVEFNGAQGALVDWNQTFFGFVPLSGIQAIANAIPDMGALTKLTFLGSGTLAEVTEWNLKHGLEDKQVTGMISMTTDMAEANLSGKFAGGPCSQGLKYNAKIVAAFLPKCT